MDYPEDDTSNDAAIAAAMSDVPIAYPVDQQDAHFVDQQSAQFDDVPYATRVQTSPPPYVPNTDKKKTVSFAPGIYSPPLIKGKTRPATAPSSYNSNTTVNKTTNSNNTPTSVSSHNSNTNKNTNLNTNKNTNKTTVRPPTAHPKLNNKPDPKPDPKSNVTKKIYHIVDNRNNLLNSLEYDIARANRLKLIGLQLIPQNNNADNQKKLEEKVNELIKKELEKKEKEKNDNDILAKVANLLKVKPLDGVSKKSKKKNSKKKGSKKKSKKKNSKKKSKK
jgi:hypothetical protein